MLGPTTPRHVDYKYGLLNLDICDGTVLFPKAVSMGRMRCRQYEVEFVDHKVVLAIEQSEQPG